jgi:hypothetical protein
MCQWALVRGRLNEDTIASFVEHVKRVASGHRPGLLVLDMAHDISAPNPLQRKLITDAVNDGTGKDFIAAHAVVSNSAIARGVLTAVNWFVTSRPYAERVFSNPREALTWLATHGDVDVEAALRDISTAAPPFETLRW